MDRARPRASRHLDLVVHFFDTTAPEYETWAGGLHRRVAARLVDFTAPQPGESCIDVGCGTGLVANAIAQLVGPHGTVIGLDVSEGMLRQAQSAARALQLPNIVYQRINAGDQLMFRDSLFDIVTFGNSISYLTDPFASLEEAARVLRSGGRVAISLRRRSLATAAQEIFFGLLDELTEQHPLVIPRPSDGRSALGEPAVIRDVLLDAGFQEPRSTMMVTGARMPSAAAWVDLMAGAGPRPHALLATLGPGIRHRLEEAVEREMRRLGDEAFHYHEAFTFAVATRC